MAKNTIAYYPQAGRVESVLVLNGGASTTVFTAGANGTKILAVYTVDSPGAGNVTLAVNNGVTTYSIYSKSGVAANEDLLDSTKLPKAANGLRYFNIEAGSTVKISNGGASSATFVVYGEDY